MTMPHPQAPVLVDTGNPLLSRSDFQMGTGSIEAPGGRLGVVTIRTPSTTLTVFLAAQELRDWAQLLEGLAGQVSGNGLVQATPQDLSLLTQLAKQGARRPLPDVSAQ